MFISGLLALTAVATAHDHLTDHTWALEIEGVTQGAFAEVSGLDSETEVIVLEGPVGLSDGLQKWLRLSAAGESDSLDFELVTTDRNGEEVRLTVIGAYVTESNTASSSDSGKGNAALTEEIEMVIERLERG